MKPTTIFTLTAAVLAFACGQALADCYPRDLYGPPAPGQDWCAENHDPKPEGADQKASQDCPVGAPAQCNDFLGKQTDPKEPQMCMADQATCPLTGTQYDPKTVNGDANADMVSAAAAHSMEDYFNYGVGPLGMGAAMGAAMSAMSQAEYAKLKEAIAAAGAQMPEGYTITQLRGPNNELLETICTPTICSMPFLAGMPPSQYLNLMKDMTKKIAETKAALDQKKKDDDALADANKNPGDKSKVLNPAFRTNAVGDNEGGTVPDGEDAGENGSNGTGDNAGTGTDGGKKPAGGNDGGRLAYHAVNATDEVSETYNGGKGKGNAASKLPAAGTTDQVARVSLVSNSGGFNKLSLKGRDFNSLESATQLRDIVGRNRMTDVSADDGGSSLGFLERLLPIGSFGDGPAIQADKVDIDRKAHCNAQDAKCLREQREGTAD